MIFSKIGVRSPHVFGAGQKLVLDIQFPNKATLVPTRS